MRIFLLTIAVFFLNITTSHALSMEDVKKGMCSTYEGSFLWSTPGTALQHVIMHVRSFEELSEDTLLVTGQGSYTVYDSVTNITFKWAIHTPSLRITMTEHDPDSDNFVTNGSYNGTLTKNLVDIHAFWKTIDTGDTGVLKLKGTECDNLLS